MATNSEDGFAQFDELIKLADTDQSPWVNGQYVPNVDLLRHLLNLPVRNGDKQESGRHAKAFDAWTAHELRRAGFASNAVWPRPRRPRVLAEDLGPLEEKLDDLARELRAAESSGERVKPAALRRAIRALDDALPGSASAYVLGDFYAKQVDVGVASWRRGPDVLISTKTMFSAYSKNLKNRHEEAVGEVTSLRHRHPMAAMGYAYLVRQDILGQPTSYAALYDILTRLRRPGATFDATLLILVDWDDSDPGLGVTLLDQPAAELNAGRFFSDMIATVIDRSPNRIHPEVRRRRGGLPVGGPLPEEGDDDELLVDDL